MFDHAEQGKVLTRWGSLCAIFVLVATVYGYGFLDFLEFKLLDLRFRLLERPPSGELILVELDTTSLKELRVWPWPRSHHAKVVENLMSAGAAQLAFDVDFSSHSSPDEDEILARALAAADPPVILPAFEQAVAEAKDQEEIASTAPLPNFARHAELASINVWPASDGRVRRVGLSAPWGEFHLPSLFAVLAGQATASRDAFYIDYGIRASAIPSLSYVDVLLGRFTPDAVAGKTVLVGATAMELGDQVPVPLFDVLPGAKLQALAYESMLQGRALDRVAPGPVLVVTLLITLLIGSRFDGWSWRQGLAALAIVASAMLLLTLAVQAAAPVTLDVTPWLLALFLCYLYALVARLNRQDASLLAQGAAVQRTSAILRQVIDTSLDAILTIDRQGIVRSFNRGAERIFGWPAERAVGKTVKALLPRANPSGAAGLALQRHDGPHETTGRRRGEGFPVEMAVAELTLDDEPMSLAIVRDISDRKKAEAQAIEARKRLSETIECLHEGFALYDSEDRLLLCNSRLPELLFGTAEAELQGLRFEQMLRICGEAGRMTMAEGRLEEWLYERVERHRNPQGVYEEELSDGRLLQVSESRTEDGGTAAIYSDITQTKRREAQLRSAIEQAEVANRSKTEFLANMSHELRTPLNAIIGFSEMMDEEIMGPVGVPRYKGYIKDIHDSGKFLLGIINDVLDVSRIEAGAYKLNEEPVDLRKTVQASLRLLYERTRELGHNITVELPKGLPALYADERAIKQILVNLLSNAIKFTPNGGKISVRAEQRPDGSLALQVADTGIGIAEEDIPKAISIFTQVDSDLTRKYEGAGLGLPLARNLIELHGGSLELESEVMVGTTVSVVFPAKRVHGGQSLSNPGDAAE